VAYSTGEALKAKNPAVWHKCGLDTFGQKDAEGAEGAEGRRSEASHKRPKLSAEAAEAAEAKAAKAAAAKAAEAKAHAESRAAARPVAGAMSVFALLQVRVSQSERVPG
jgi:hypothetical protein